jgi:signal transduction histidine kinase
VALDLDDVPAFSLMGDEVKLSWALSNLVGNAIRYTPPGGHVHVAAQSADHALLLSVRDEGPGIPADQRERIFDRFVQGTSAGEMGAAGLGLSIVRDIVQAHRGRVHLDSIMGRGTCFTLELPLE